MQAANQHEYLPQAQHVTEGPAITTQTNKQATPPETWEQQVGKNMTYEDTAQTLTCHEHRTHENKRTNKRE